jgi:hypothetical protein
VIFKARGRVMGGTSIEAVCDDVAVEGYLEIKID